jgi:hypothetical protein
VIYGRTGKVLNVLRYAVLADIARLDDREPDEKDFAAVRDHSYVVVLDPVSGKELLYHQAFLKADGGLAEIAEALRLGAP